MTGEWDPDATPPEKPSLEEAERWLIAQLTAYQYAHPDAPQGDVCAMERGQQEALVRAFDLARKAGYSGNDGEFAEITHLARATAHARRIPWCSLRKIRGIQNKAGSFARGQFS